MRQVWAVGAVLQQRDKFCFSCERRVQVIVASFPGILLQKAQAQMCEQFKGLWGIIKDNQEFVEPLKIK